MLTVKGNVMITIYPCYNLDDALITNIISEITSFRSAAIYDHYT